MSSEIVLLAIHSNTVKEEPAVKEFKNVIVIKLIYDQMLLEQKKHKQEFPC